MSARSTKTASQRHRRSRRGRADLGRLRSMTKREIQATSPLELSDLPADFWAIASVVEPVSKQPISL